MPKAQDMKKKRRTGRMVRSAEMVSRATTERELADEEKPEHINISDLKICSVRLPNFLFGKRRTNSMYEQKMYARK